MVRWLLIHTNTQYQVSSSHLLYSSILMYTRSGTLIVQLWHLLINTEYQISLELQLVHLVLQDLKVDSFGSPAEPGHAFLVLVVVLAALPHVVAPSHPGVPSAAPPPITIAVKHCQVVAVPKNGPHLLLAPYQVFLAAGLQTLLKVQLEHECLFSLVVDVDSVVACPGVVSEASQSFAELGGQQQKSVGTVVAQSVEGHRSKVVLRGSEKEDGALEGRKELVEKGEVARVVSELEDAGVKQLVGHAPSVVYYYQQS